MAFSCLHLPTATADRMIWLYLVLGTCIKP
jgi:hypothetical protein